MRQAGRYLPEYQAVRAKHTFLQICKTPEVAAEVSLQPYPHPRSGRDHRFLGHPHRRRSDGLAARRARFRPGALQSHPGRSRGRAAPRFRSRPRNKFVGDAIRAICKEAGPDVPVIGFAAAPWTLACYMIEGRTRGDISRAKQMLHEQPQVVRPLLDRIARATAEYLKMQIAAGASVIQLFDTWAGELSPSEYHAFELPATQQIFEALRGAPAAAP